MCLCPQNLLKLSALQAIEHQQRDRTAAAVELLMQDRTRELARSNRLGMMVFGTLVGLAIVAALVALAVYSPGMPAKASLWWQSRASKIVPLS